MNPILTPSEYAADALALLDNDPARTIAAVEKQPMMDADYKRAVVQELEREQ